MDLIKRNLKRYILFIILSMLSAGGNMALVYLINKSVTLFFGEKKEVPFIYVAYFSGALLFFLVCRWMVSLNIIRFTHETMKSARLEILKTILSSPYLPLIKNKERMYTAMTRDVGNIVQASVNFVDVFTSGIIVIICFVYMAIVSWKLLLSMIVLLLITIFIYAYSEVKGRALFKKALAGDDRFIKYLNEVLMGFKEIVVNRKKGQDIAQQHIVPSLDQIVTYNRKASVVFLNNRVMGQVAFYVFIGMLILLQGRFLQLENSVLVNFIFLILYVFGPIETIAVLVPSFSQTKSSIERLARLKADLKYIDAERGDDENKPVFEGVLSFKNICYKYPDSVAGEPGFSVGPIDFEIEANSIVFLFGGNGSGKTTLVNMLVGLFEHQQGEVWIGQVRIGNTMNAAYRSLFAPVLSDFHLFDEFYGIGDIDEEKARGYIELFELTGKVSLSGARFTTIELSTGQRKRLALIYALLEKRPVIVLDEFAADQDPRFRRKFYFRILQQLKEEGFTIIAITHDDHYYHCSDHLYKMEYGKLHKVRLDPDKLLVD